MTPIRGRTYAVHLEHLSAEKYFLVVSNNRRNEALQSCLAVRITTAPKPVLPSIVELTPQDPLVGRVLCDDLCEIFHDEIRRDLGALSIPTMTLVAAGLRAALSI